MPRKKDTTKENAIIEAAVKIFSQKSYHGTTTNEIAKEAGVAEGTIFRYFKTKKEILSKILIKVIEVQAQPMVVDTLKELLEKLDDNNIDEKEFIKTLVKDRLQVARKNFLLLKVLFTEVQYHADLRKTWVEKIAKPSMALAKTYIEKKKQEGKFRADIDSEVAIRSFVGMVSFMILSKAFLYDKLDFAFDEELEQVVDLFFEGITIR